MDKASKQTHVESGNNSKHKNILLKQIKNSNVNKQIKLRTRAVPTKKEPDKQSLFLDFSSGKREKTYLRLYLSLKPKDKIQDQNTIKLAMQIRDKKELELFENGHGFQFKNKNEKTNFVEYFKSLVDSKPSKSRKPWKNTYNHLNKFTKGILLVKDFNEKFAEQFKAYLLKKVSQNSAHTYFAKLKAAIKAARKEKIINQDPTLSISIPQVQTKREFLHIEEIRLLKKAHCVNEQTKRAFLFSCFTGLRISDIKNLTFDNIQGEYLEFRQMKTGSVERNLLHKNALNIIDQQRADGHISGFVFSLSADNNTNNHIKKWVENAGIKKHITWHIARHTFATLNLTYDNDIYTVSKLLGHKDIKATQIYAKLIDQKKDEAIKKLPTI